MATGVPKGSRRPSATPAATLSYAGRDVSEGTAATVARVAGAEAAQNRLYLADNLDVLRALANDAQVRGRVRLVYIDPPFATGSAFVGRDGHEEGYDDFRIGGPYLEFMRRRLVLLRELLAADGSLYVHLDATAVFHVKVLLDEVFGPAMFRNCIVRTKCNPKNYTRNAFGGVVDYILFYTKSDAYVWHRPYEEGSAARTREYHAIEPGTGRRFMKVPVHAPGLRSGETGQPWRGKPPPPGKHWQHPPRVLDEMDARGEIHWSARGNPRKKVYLDERPGVPVQDLWLDCKDAHNQNAKITGYPTEKNPELLRRIVAASSDPGDLVLDCFAGSGTTLAAAAELGRRFVGVDCGAPAIRATLLRLRGGSRKMGDFVRPERAAAVAAGGPALSLWAEASRASEAEALAREAGLLAPC